MMKAGELDLEFMGGLFDVRAEVLDLWCEEVVEFEVLLVVLLEFGGAGIRMG